MTYCYSEVGTRCLGFQSGTQNLMNFLLERHPRSYNLGTYVCREVRGGGTLSTHAEGRGGDSGFRQPGPGQIDPAGTVLADWLVKHAELLGVQRVIWNRRSWDSKRLSWTPYSGVSPHQDHVHWELCWRGARELTYAALVSLFPLTPPPAPAPVPVDPPIGDDMALPVRRGTTGPLYAIIGGKAKTIPNMDTLVWLVNAKVVHSGNHLDLDPMVFDKLFGPAT